jgi:hypothetical protein
MGLMPVIRAAALTSGIGQFAAIQSVAPGLRVELRPVGIGDAGEIERAFSTFAREPDGVDLGQVKHVVCAENVRSECSLRSPQQTVPLQRFCPIDRLAPCTLPELF